MKKNEKSKDVFRKEIKSFFYESVLIFHKKWEERGVFSPFKFFLSTP